MKKDGLGILVMRDRIWCTARFMPVRSKYYKYSVTSKIAMKEFFIFIIFLIHIHVLMLCRKFELIPINIGFFTNFLNCSKI